MKFTFPLIVSLLAVTPGLSSPVEKNRRPLTMKRDDEPLGAGAVHIASLRPNPGRTDPALITSSVPTQEAQVLSGVELITAATLPCLNSTFRTHIKIYVVSTGNDAGDNISEIGGEVQFWTGTRIIPPANLSDETFFTSENHGLGRLLFDTQIVTAFIPANFRAYLEEQDNPPSSNAPIMDKMMDWTIPSNLQYANGFPWTQEWHNTADIAYKAKIWFQVTKLS